MDRGTFSRLERGDPGISIGAYVNVLRVYNLEQEILTWATHDELGRKLQDLDLL